MTCQASGESRSRSDVAVRCAARTSDSPRIIAAARRAMPMLQTGERLREALEDLRASITRTLAS